MSRTVRIREKIISFCLFLAVCSMAALQAQEQAPLVIGEVVLDIEGKTREHILLQELDLVPYEEQFATLDDLKRRAEERKQFLFNKRIFESVEADVLPTDDPSVYRVVFDIVDGSTFLPIPVGKYDSNYGAKLGVKLYDTNLFGLLSNLYIDTSIRQLNVTAVDEFNILSIVNLSDLPIFSHRFDLSMTLNINSVGGVLQNGTFTGALTWDDIFFNGQALGFFSNLTLKQYSSTDISIWGDPNLNAGFNWRGIPAAGETFDIRFNTNLQKTGTSWDNPNLTFTTRVSTTALKMAQRTVPTYIEHIYAFRTLDGEMTSHKISTGASQAFSLPLGITYSLGANLLTDHTQSLFDEIDLSTSHSFSRGRINWNDNYREGDSTSITFSTLMPVDSGISAMTEDFSTHLIVRSTLFGLFRDRLNLSARLTGFAATNAAKYFPVTPGEYMRGILDRNLPNTSGYAGLTINTNFTFKFFDFTIYIFNRSPDGDLLLSPFLDAAFFDTTPIGDGSGLNWARFSGGLEMYIIFDSYRSFPFCATVGFDLENFASFVEGNIKFKEIEFEIVLSLSMFY